MQVYVKCSECGRGLGGYQLKGREHTIEAYVCQCARNEIERLKTLITEGMHKEME